MNDAPSITELLETIAELTGALRLTVRYCEHPEVAEMPFAMKSTAAAQRANRAITQAEQVLRNAGY